ncbi:MAG: hypothetical protein LC127_14005 [Chitinophagales bacterium]|nr:hypothetical protein [Chitinophagales bacterium]
MKNKLISVCTFFLFIPFISMSQYRSENLFYMTNSEESLESFRNNVNQISIVAPQVFYISSEGVIHGAINPEILDIATANNIKVIPLIVNRGFTPDILHAVLTSEIARERAINMMLIFAKQYKIAGWQFDLEGLDISDRDNFTSFFTQTADSLHKYKLSLSAAVVHSLGNTGGPTEYSDFLFRKWRGGYDSKRLSEVGDFISIMTYSQHTRRTTPGPVAGVDWIEKVVNFLLSEGVHPEKLSLGIPTYSTYWFSDYTEERGGFSNARSAKFNEVKILMHEFNPELRWDANSKCNYAMWQNGGLYEYVFIENGKSLAPKIELLEKYKLRGISVWVLGGEDPEFWNILREKTIRK